MNVLAGALAVGETASDEQEITAEKTLSAEQQQILSMQENIHEHGAEDLRTINKKKLMLLIESRLAMEHLFQNPNCKKAKYWNQIQAAFKEQGYSDTSAELASKWKNLMVTYNRNVDKLKKTGESAITWEYFKIMHDKLGKRKNVFPSKESLGSTFAIKGPTNKPLTSSQAITPHYSSSTSPPQSPSSPLQHFDKPNTTTPKVSTNNTPSLSTSVEHPTPLQQLSFSPTTTKKGQKRSAQAQDLYGLLKEKKTEDLEFKKQMWMEKKELALKKLKTLDNLVSALEHYHRTQSSSSENEDN